MGILKTCVGGGFRGGWFQQIGCCRLRLRCSSAVCHAALSKTYLFEAAVYLWKRMLADSRNQHLQEHTPLILFMKHNSHFHGLCNMVWAPPNKTNHSNTNNDENSSNSNNNSYIHDDNTTNDNNNTNNDDNNKTWSRPLWNSPLRPSPAGAVCALPPYLSIYLSVCLSVCLSISPSLSLFLPCARVPRRRRLRAAAVRNRRPKHNNNILIIVIMIAIIMMIIMITISLLLLS